jgi:hypothetical protein
LRCRHHRRQPATGPTLRAHDPTPSNPRMRDQRVPPSGLAQAEKNLVTGPASSLARYRGGRKKTEIANPELLDALDALIEPETRGDPESPLRWTTKSTRHLADALTAVGHRVSHSVVAKILGSLGYRSRTLRPPSA